MTPVEKLEHELDKVQKALSAGDLPKASRIMLTLLIDFKDNIIEISEDQATYDPLIVQRARRFLRLFIQLYLVFPLKVSDKNAGILLRSKNIIDRLYKMADCPYEALVRGAASHVDFFIPDSRKVLLVKTLDHLTDADLKFIQTLPGSYRLRVITGFLMCAYTLTAQGDRARNVLIRMSSTIKDEVDIDLMLRSLTISWMACSYATIPDRHRLKPALNRQHQAWLKRQGIDDFDEVAYKASPAVQTRKKPRVLVITESFGQGHAMNRCYAPSIEALRGRFETVHMSAEERSVDTTRHLFDKAVCIPMTERDPQKFLKTAREFEPDLVFQPSVGLRPNGIAMANCRAAPIQVATLGHPATTGSSMMDYFILSEDFHGGDNLFTETIIRADHIPEFVLPDNAEAIKPNVRPRPPKIRIAVPAWERKINYLFIKACKEVLRRSKRPVEFIFFPNLSSASYFAMKTEIEKVLPARVLPRSDFNTYIKNINNCDIHFSSFPFGSTNGIIDSALQGLPLLNLLGAEPHGRIDASLVAMLDQPDWLTATTIDGYVDAAVKLVNNDGLRVKISNAILKSNPRQHFFSGGDRVDPHVFSEIFDLLLKKHDRLKARGKASLRMADLRAF